MAWRLVDEVHALVSQLRQRGHDIVHLVADMVRALAALGQEAGGAAFLVRRRNEFDGAVSCVQEGRLHELFGYLQPLQKAHVHLVTICFQTLVEAVHDDAHVVEPVDFHGYTQLSGRYSPKTRRNASQISPSVA